MERHLLSRRAGSPVLGALLLVGLACGDSPVETFTPLTQVDLSQPWQVADPASQGLDAEQLESAADLAAEQDRARSLLVVHGGRIVLERYFGDANRETLHDVRSVTKTVVSTLVGLAIEDGHIESVDQTLGELLPDSIHPLRPEQRDITIEHLLTMSAGFAWTESGSAGYNAWITSGDHLGHFLDPEMTSAPGETFNYNSGAIYLLGLLVEEATGMELEAYADERLFGPLGISARVWEPMADGRVNGGAGIDLRARDLARLGQLFLQGGSSGGVDVLPAGWAEQATSRRFAWTSNFGPIDQLNYGYLWWLDLSRDAYLAWGYGGQFVYVLPAKHLVVVTTTNWRLLSQDGGPTPLEQAMLDVIINRVVQAIPPG